MTTEAQVKQWVWFFGEALPDGAEPKMLLGGKGASLAEMTKAGLRVPPGFTISTEACQWYFEHGEEWPPGLQEQVRSSLARLEEATGRQFGRGSRPLLVSVRSGAAASMPGMMDTILNCGLHPALAEEVGDGPRFWRTYTQFIHAFARIVAHCSLDDESEKAPASRDAASRLLDAYRRQTGREFPIDPWRCLLECVDGVFRSWNSERADAYRRKNDIRGLAGTAVNVQAMFPSRISGVLFTQNPNALANNEMVIESAYGLGESVVSGDVTPDRFVVRRGDHAAAVTTIGHKGRCVAALEDDAQGDPDVASLSRPQIDELCAIAMKVEEHFGKAMDIEWGWADGRFAVLQCRPIRGLEVAADVEVGRQEEIARLGGLAGGGRRVWIAHNLGETLRFPTPLTWDIVGRFMSGAGGFGLMYEDLGYRPSRLVRERGFLELICGRIYADADRAAQLFWDHWPKRYDVEELASDKSLLDRPPECFDIKLIDESSLLRLPGQVWAGLRGSRLAQRARRRAKDDFDKIALPAFLDYVRHKREQDLGALSTEQLLGELDERRRRVLDEFGKESLKPGSFGGVALASVESLLTQLMGKAEGTRLATELVMGLEGDITFEQNAMLYQVAHTTASMAEFLERFGHRASGEMELSVPRWREEPASLERVTAQLRRAKGASPDEIHRANVERRLAATRDLPAALRSWGGSSLREEIERDLAEAHMLLPYREVGKHYLMMGYELIRKVILELSGRWDLGGGIFFLHLDELPLLERDRARLASAIEQRKVRWQAMQRLEMPDVIDSQSLDLLGMSAAIASSDELAGDAVAAGVATGPARVVFDPLSAGELGDGYILVCPSTDPGWTPLFINARGLVVERGGLLSHGAIVARDFGIPAVVCPRATSLIKPGATVRVDGNTGKVTLIKEGERA